MNDFNTHKNKRQSSISHAPPFPGSIGAGLAAVEEELKQNGVIRPRRHAELLFETALGIDRVALYLRAAEELSLEAADVVNRLKSERLQGKPIQYITGWAPFWGREFKITEGVFIPRFDTELLIDLFQKRFPLRSHFDYPLQVLDLCCGCGVLGLTIAAEYPCSFVTLVDNSPAAVRICLENVRRLGIQERVAVELRDALDLPLDWNNRFQAVLANPPYIPVEEVQWLNLDVQREPHAALTDGGDGLSFYRYWSRNLPEILQPGGWFAIEIGDGAAESVQAIFEKAQFTVQVFNDINGLPRAVAGEMPMMQHAEF